MEQEINRYDFDTGFNLYTVSVWRNQVEAAHCFVGIIISK